MLRQIIFGGHRGVSFSANLGILALRVFAGLGLMFGHGIDKIRDPSKVIGAAAGMGFPFPTLFGWAAAFSEFFAAGLLVLGLLTRISSFLIACTMTVAFLGVHLGDPFERQEKALLYFFVAIMFLLKGAGDWSIDALISKEE